MENIEKPIEGVYIQVIENKKVVQKYVPLKDVKLNGNGGMFFKEYIHVNNAKIDALNKDILRLDKKIDSLQTSFATIIKAVGGLNDNEKENI